jgi:hypothetical protein
MCAVTCLCWTINTRAAGAEQPYVPNLLDSMHPEASDYLRSVVGFVSGGHVSSSSLFLLRVAPPCPLRCWGLSLSLHHPRKPKTPACLGNGTLVGPPTVPLKDPRLSLSVFAAVSLQLLLSWLNRPADRRRCLVVFLQQHCHR